MEQSVPFLSFLMGNGGVGVSPLRVDHGVLQAMITIKTNYGVFAHPMPLLMVNILKNYITLKSK